MSKHKNLLNHCRQLKRSKYYLENSIHESFLKQGHIFLGFSKFQNFLVSYQVVKLDESPTTQNGVTNFFEETEFSVVLNFWSWQNLSTPAVLKNSIPLFKNIQITDENFKLFYLEQQEKIILLAQNSSLQSYYVTIFKIDDFQTRVDFKFYAEEHESVTNSEFWIQKSGHLDGFLGNFGGFGIFVAEDGAESDSTTSTNLQSCNLCENAINQPDLEIDPNFLNSETVTITNTEITNTTAQISPLFRSKTSTLEQQKDEIIGNFSASCSVSNFSDPPLVRPDLNFEVPGNFPEPDFIQGFSNDQEIPVVRLLNKKFNPIDPNYAPKRWEFMWSEKTKNLASQPKKLVKEDAIYDFESESSQSKIRPISILGVGVPDMLTFCAKNDKIT